MWSERQAGQVAAFYTTKVRITVRAGGEIIMREGIGTGFGRAAFADAAHEIGLKAAEADATKRALATFGNPFGLALYDKEHGGLTRPPPPPAQFVLSPSEDNEVAFTAQRENLPTRHSQQSMESQPSMLSTSSGNAIARRCCSSRRPARAAARAFLPMLSSPHSKPGRKR